MRAAYLAFFLSAISMFMVACNQSTTNQTKPASAVTPTPSATASPDEFASARTNFDKHCSKCHGDNGSGGPVTVDAKRLKVPSLREGHALRHTDEEFVKQISNGGDGMPGFKDKLKPEDISGLVRFIHREFQAGATQMKPGMKMK